MLKTYKVSETWTLKRYTTIEANSKAEALAKVEADPDFGLTGPEEAVQIKDSIYRVESQIVRSDFWGEKRV